MKRSMQLALVLAAMVGITMPARAQSPNTSAVIVVVTDQSGGMVKDARVTVTNDQTGAVRESTSSGDGSIAFPALPLTGTYTVSVSKDGFGTEQRKGITLRAGETATVKMKLLVGSE